MENRLFPQDLAKPLPVKIPAVVAVCRGDNCLSAVSLAWLRPGFLKQAGHNQGSGTEMVCVQKLHFKEEKRCRNKCCLM